MRAFVTIADAEKIFEAFVKMSVADKTKYLADEKGKLMSAGLHGKQLYEQLEEYHMSTKTNHGAKSLGALRADVLLEPVASSVKGFKKLAHETREEILAELGREFQGKPGAEAFLAALRAEHDKGKGIN